MQTTYKGSVVTVIESGPKLTKVSDQNEHEFYVPSDQLKTLESRGDSATYGSQSDKVKYASGKVQELAMEMLDYVLEQQPLIEPTGAKGKILQAEWRTRQGLRPFDPMSSTLSTWTSYLAYNGLIRQLDNGSWVAVGHTEIDGRLKTPPKGWKSPRAPQNEAASVHQQ